LKFANLNKCRIYYDNKDFKYKSTSTIKDKEFQSYLPLLYEYIQKINESLNFNCKIILNNKYQFINIEVFSCSEIKLECKNQVIPYGICFYKIENKKLKIYYLKNDVYKSFKHPTIAYYIAFYICNYLKLEKFRNSLLPIIMNLGDEDVINEFINNII